MSPKRQSQIKRVLSIYKERRLRGRHMLACKHGHPWTIENTRFSMREGKQVRACVTCCRKRSSAHNEKTRLARIANQTIAQEI